MLIHKPAEGPGGIPSRVNKMLNSHYPGWKLADFNAGGDAACATRAGASPAVLNLDLNTDGFGDWVLEVQTRDAVKLVAVMGWLADFRTMELESLPAGPVDRFLVRLPRGSKFLSPVTKSDDYLGHNSVATETCAGDRVIYAWDGDGFQKIIPAGK